MGWFVQGRLISVLMMGRIGALTLIFALRTKKTNKSLLSTVDKQNPYYQGSDYTVGKATKINDKVAKVLIPEDKDDFTGNKSYFIIEENAFFVFDENAGRLIELPGV